MKKILKFLTIIPIFLLYVVVVEFVFGIGTKDIWEDLTKWAKKN